MNELVVKENEKIENLIYEIRGKQVMLDSDLARLYGVETKRINEAVKNNYDKFPERFSWVLNDKDVTNLRSKISTSSYGGRRYNPRVFTEQGVAMLATILKSKIATRVSIAIMDAFVLMRRYISTNLVEQKYINNQVLKNTEDIKILKETFDEFKPKINSIFYEGQIYDAYSLLMDILNKANNSIIIIDNYAGKELLDILKDINKPITIISKNINETIKNKYLKQYNNITFINNDTFHDRFIIIDNNILFTCGASFKDLGKKCFCLSRIEDKEILNSLLKKI
ncbi:MAG: ORF6N domain-containing protein [Firmicutes bacterium]|jgi:hypothetical protein|nr:ORF6N domain-containing protein [Bacillota bacterium]